MIRLIITRLLCHDKERDQLASHANNTPHFRERHNGLLYHKEGWTTRIRYCRDMGKPLYIYTLTMRVVACAL